MFRYSLDAFEISSLSSRTLGYFGILVLEPCLVSMNAYFCISRNISPFSTDTASNTLR